MSDRQTPVSADEGAARPGSDASASSAAQSHGFDMRAAILDDAKAKLRMIRDEPRFELLLPSEADEVLRALGEDEDRRAL